jgi:hypothetical protein
MRQQIEQNEAHINIDFFVEQYEDSTAPTNLNGNIQSHSLIFILCRTLY